MHLVLENVSLKNAKKETETRPFTQTCDKIFLLCNSPLIYSRSKASLINRIAFV